LETPILPSYLTVSSRLNDSRRPMTLMTQRRKTNKATIAKAATMRRMKSIIRRHSRDISSKVIVEIRDITVCYKY
jgi:hypothetical protein